MLVQSSSSDHIFLFVVAAASTAAGLAMSRRGPELAHGAVALGVILNAAVSGRVPLLWITAIAALLIAAYTLSTWTIRLFFGAIVIAAVGIAGLVSELANAGRWMNGVPELNVEIGFWWAAQVGILWAATLGIRAIIDSRMAKRQLAETQLRVAETEQRATSTESALRDERLRTDLTRDFHDVMAHSLAVLAAQAEGLRLTHEKHPERIGPVLETISETARLSLIEVRGLLERSESAELLGLDDLPGLVEQVRSAGLRLSIHTIGQPQPLGRTAELAAYRVTQEALTNALRHGAQGGDVRAVLSWMGPGLALTISSATNNTEDFEAGRGILGMRERTETAGGAFEASASQGSFVVSVFLPANSELAAAEALGGGAPSRDVTTQVASARVPNPLSDTLGKGRA